MPRIYTHRQFIELLESGKVQQALTAGTGYIIAVAGEKQYLMNTTSNGIELTRIEPVKLECMLASSWDPE